MVHRATRGRWGGDEMGTAVLGGIGKWLRDRELGSVHMVRWMVRTAYSVASFPFLGLEGKVGFVIRVEGPRAGDWRRLFPGRVLHATWPCGQPPSAPRRHQFLPLRCRMAAEAWAGYGEMRDSSAGDLCRVTIAARVVFRNRTRPRRIMSWFRMSLTCALLSLLCIPFPPC